MGEGRSGGGKQGGKGWAGRGVVQMRKKGKGKDGKSRARSALQVMPVEKSGVGREQSGEKWSGRESREVDQ